MDRKRQGYIYADSKERAEQIIAGSGIDYCIVRPTIILGKESPIWASFVNLASKSLIVLPGDGNVKIQPIHVTDMADLLLDIVDTSAFDNQVLEAGGPEVLSMNDFVRRIHRTMQEGEARIFHLPLGPLVGGLRLFEKVFPNLLPVNSGQFSSFRNDSTAADNALTLARKDGMKNIDAMFSLMTAGSPDV